MKKMIIAKNEFTFLHAELFYEIIDCCKGYGKAFQYMEKNGYVDSTGNLDINCRNFLIWYSSLTWKQRHELAYC